MGQVIPPLLKYNNFIINLKFSKANVACRSRAHLDGVHSCHCHQNTVQTAWWPQWWQELASPPHSSFLCSQVQGLAKGGKERDSLVSTFSRSPDLAEQVWHTWTFSACWDPRGQEHPVRGSCWWGQRGDSEGTQWIDSD